MYYFFYLPVGTELPVRRQPSAVIAITTLNVLWFGLFHLVPGSPLRLGALAYDASHPSLVTALTACFLHADWFHLLGNLAYLATLGPALEERIGSGRFLLLYLACGLLGMGAQTEAWRLGWLGSSQPVILGASGAIAGILGLFLVRCGFARVRVAHVTMALVQAQSRYGTTPINGALAVAAWALLQAIYAWVSYEIGAGSTAYAAHLGGLAAGIFFGVAFGFRQEGRVERLWTQARRYATRGEHFAALGETLTYLGHRPRDPEAWLEAARLQRILKRPREAARAWYRGILLLWLNHDRDEAVRAARELRRHYPGARLKPSLLFRLALYLERSGDLGWASHTFEDYARHYPRHDRAPRALLRAARIEAHHRNDLVRAKKLLDFLLERHPESAEAVPAARELAATQKILANRGQAA
jgi:membrane associated rhomboid family serine protease